MVFLQATSPVRTSADVERALELVREQRADSLLSASRDHRLLWRVEDGAPRPLNWQLEHRPRSQELDGQWVENGSIYVFRPGLLRATGNRLGGTIALLEMDVWSSFELDTPEDLRLLEWILTVVRPGPPSWPERISLVAFDFDGVMTDNSARIGAGGVETVSVSRADGLGIARLRETGLPLVVLSTERHPVVAERCAKLGLECVQGLDDKAGALRDLLDARGIRPEHVVFVGNDVNDLGCFELVGLPVAVADAQPGAPAAGLARPVAPRRARRGARALRPAARCAEQAPIGIA